jgi:hypothetical protein
MLGQACTPDSIDEVAGLNNPTFAARVSAMHQARVTPVVAREQLHHRSSLTMRPRSQHDTFVTPIHLVFSTHQ